MAEKRSKKRRKRRVKAYASRSVFFIVISFVVLLLSIGAFRLVQNFQPADSAIDGGDSIEVKKDGTIYGYIEEDFSKDYYETDGLKSMIEAEIAEYAKISGSQTCVELKDFSVDNGMVNVLLVYESAQDYRSYNNTVLYTGMVSELIEQGVSFDRPLLSADAEGNALPSDNLSSVGASHAVVFNEKVSVKVPGKILYHSDNVSLTVKKTVVANGDSTESAVIIY